MGIGLLLGGVLTEYLSWRWCMYVNVGFAALALVGGLLLLHDSLQSERPSLDMAAGSSYATTVLPATIFGLGAGLVVSSATSKATARVSAEDAGVASAMVNTGQQVGGSVGTALLSTLAASAATSYARSHRGPNVAELATLHSYTTAFGWSAVVLGIGAVLAAVILRGEVPEVDDNAATVVAI